MDQFQKTININTTTSSNDLCRLNQFALRETEDGTYQFITVPPRSIEQEYIDHVTNITFRQQDSRLTVRVFRVSLILTTWEVIIFRTL